MSERENLRVSCPRCKVQTRWAGNPHRPFCCEKCRLTDLGRWADEEYRIAGRQVGPEELGNLVAFPRKD